MIKIKRLPLERQRQQNDVVVNKTSIMCPKKFLYICLCLFPVISSVTSFQNVPAAVFDTVLRGFSSCKGPCNKNNIIISNMTHKKNYKNNHLQTMTQLFSSSKDTAPTTEEQLKPNSTNENENEEDVDSSTLSSEKLLTNADNLMKVQDAVSSMTSNINSDDGDDGSDGNEGEESTVLDRRLFFGAALLGAGGIVAQQQFQGMINEQRQQQTTRYSNYGKLEWSSTPVNKRTGVTVFDAEKAGYNVRFVTYLARFLLVFDNDCQKWWYSRAADIPRRATADEVEQIRLKQFGAFSASVEVGLQEYRGSDGPAKLMQSLLLRYCPTMERVQRERRLRSLPPLSEQEENKERREIKEARRQIALLFGLMETNQPTDSITKLLAAIDNGSVSFVTIEDGGSGYAPGYGSPLVTFPPPKAGDGFRTALGRAILEPNGQLLRIDLINRGFGYQKSPTVEISPPGADRGVSIPGSTAATAKAMVFRNGINKGRLERIQITNPGTGYIDGEKIRIVIGPPELPADQGGVKATAKPILEYKVGGIEIVDGGTGYAIEKPVPVTVEPPPLTARINMNDPLSARVIDPTKPLPTATIPSPNVRAQRLDIDDPDSFASRVDKMAKNDGKGGGGGCFGRACYDRPVEAYATAQAEASSFSEFRTETDARTPVQKEQETVEKVISGKTAGSDSQLPTFWTGGPSSSSAQLVTLIPAGLGLEYDRRLQRYVLSAEADFIDINRGSQIAMMSNRPLDPEFGPRGRSPIERDLKLDLSSFLRFCASGAICASGVHFVLTPLDVIKTKIQTDPENYPGVITSFQKLTQAGGIAGFFTGWIPTTIGFFFWGGFTYSVTELLRRYFNDYLGPAAPSFEVPVILAASAISSFFSVFILCPFEAVRIRSIAQPGYGKNALEVTTRMVKEEGALSLFSAVPPFMLKEIPFGVTKFFVFGLTTKLLYETFPVAQEDIQLSLLVSLAGGMAGGLGAAIVSNPADATISEMKKAKTEIGPVDAAQALIARGGYANLMRGLPIRMVFYPLITSMQFLVYDAVRIYLGVGADDLKVYLDVLGGALREGGSMVGPV